MFAACSRTSYSGKARAQVCLLEMLKQPLLTLQALLAQIAGYVTQCLPVATLENVARATTSPAALFGQLDWLQGCHRLSLELPLLL